MKYEQGYIDNRLVAVCNYCGETIAIPQQDWIKKELNRDTNEEVIGEIIQDQLKKVKK
jgi:hypothetical protein